MIYMNLPSLHFFDVPDGISKEDIRSRTNHRIWIEDMHKGGQRSLHILFSIADHPSRNERINRKQEVEDIYWRLFTEAHFLR